MAKIFISYRREDSQHAVDRLQDAIKPYLKNPKRDLFVDVDNIPIGVDFKAHLQAKISQCDAVLAVMGPSWLTVRNANGKARLNQPEDFVRTEIAAALQRGIPVVPVLLDGTPMPRAEQLPADIRGLVKRHGAQLDRKSFRADVDHIMSGLGFEQRKSALPKILAGIVSVAALAAIGVWGVQNLEFGSGPERAEFEASAIETPVAQEITIDSERSDLIRRLETALKALNYMDDRVESFDVETTMQALTMFSLSDGFEPADLEYASLEEVEKSVLRAEAAVIKSNQVDSAEETYAGFILVERATLIERYQKALAKLGYYQGSINGRPDSATHDATKAFSKDHDLTNLGLDFADLDAIQRQVAYAEDLVANMSNGGFKVIDK